MIYIYMHLHVCLEVQQPLEPLDRERTLKEELTCEDQDEKEP